MKKLLSVAFCALAFMAVSAQNYSVETYTSSDENWNGNYDSAILIADPIAVDVYDDYVILHEFLGKGSIDLKVSFDEDENITGVTPITGGIEGDTFTSGYSGIDTGAEAYYYAQLYLVESYDYAFADETGGYVTLSGYFYTSQTEYIWAYYNVVWEGPDANAPLYTAAATPEVDEDWASMFADGYILFDNEVEIEGYEDCVILRGWTGALGDDLKITVDADDNITSLTPITDDVEGETSTGGYVNIPISHPDYYYVQIYVGEGYSYANISEGEGYIIFGGYFYVSEEEYVYKGYSLTWGNDDGSVEMVPLDENKAAEYFNLRGMKVTEPTNGIYIKRSGNKAEKVAM